MKIRNEVVRIKTGKKKYDFHNFIFNNYLERFAKIQLDDESSSENDLKWLYVKFDDPIEFDEDSELTPSEFDVGFYMAAKMMQEISEQQITVLYQYSTRNVKLRVTSGGMTSIDEFFGRRITALGFSVSSNSSTIINAIVDTSHYNIYLQENQEFSVTRKDIITTDALYSSNNLNIKGPLHLAPCAVNDYYAKLYSVGLGHSPLSILQEHVVGKTVSVVQNKGEIEITGVENTECGPSLYPSPNIYPSAEIYPQKANYTWISLRYKVFQNVYDYDLGYWRMVDTGYYYIQSLPLTIFGTLKLKIKYERG